MEDWRMRILHGKRQRSLFYIGLLGIILALVLAACGGSGNGTINPGGPMKPAPTAAPGNSTANGCPSDMVVNNQPQAGVTVKPSGASTTITAHPGEVITVLMPFGHKWTGPTSSQGILELQSPYGYASKANNACVWNFVARSAGTAHLNFQGQAICKKGGMCPMYVMLIPVTINVK
jgi:hypothetical protein